MKFLNSFSGKPLWRMLFGCFFLIFYISTVKSQESWKGEWIGVNSLLESNLWVCYKKCFKLRYLPIKAISQISTDSKYWLYINGQLVVREGQLKRGPNPNDTYYDELDIAPFLKPGNNSIAILTWYWGKQGFAHNSSGQPAVLFQNEKLKVFTDTSWWVKIHPAFYNPAGPQPNFRLAETNVGYDARKDINWINNKEETKWHKSATFGLPPIAPWHNLIKRPIPFWRDYGLKQYVKTKLSSNDTIVCLLPYNAQVNPYMKMDAPPGIKIEILTDNYFTAGKKELASVRTEYITKEGVQEFECPNWMNGHVVYYLIPKEVHVLNLQFRETGYATTLSGSFSSNDLFLDKLWKKAQRTLYLNMRDNYFDCPDRERAQWWGDVVIEIGQSFYALDTTANQLSKKAINNLIDWQQKDSSLYSPIPAGNWDKELSVQMLASIYGIGTYYQYTGDTSVIYKIYPSLKKYLKLWQLGNDGLVIHRKGGWDWADWGKNIDVPLLDNAWYSMAMQRAVQFAKLIGDEESADAWQSTISKLSKAFNKNFWNGNAYHSKDYSGETDERGQALAVLAGIATKEKYPAIKIVLAGQFHASPYMEKYVLESLYVMNEPAAALLRIKKRYQKMVDHPNTTLWELFDKEEESTNDHAWTGGPLTLLSQYAAGVAPELPGYERYHIFPQLGGLKIIHSIHHSVKGKITVDVSELDNMFRVSANVLPNCTVIVGIPSISENAFKTIRLNGRLIMGNNAFIKKEVVEYLGYKSGYLQFRLFKKGIYTFLAKR